MKKIAFFAMMVMVVALASGCSKLIGEGGPTGPCVAPQTYIDRQGNMVKDFDPVDTALCKYLPYASEVRAGLFVANNFALRGDAYEPEDAIKFLDKCQTILDSSKTVGELAKNTLVQLNLFQEYAPEVFIATEVLAEDSPALISTEPVDDFTYYRLDRHLAQQRMLVQMHMSRWDKIKLWMKEVLRA